MEKLKLILKIYWTSDRPNNYRRGRNSFKQSILHLENNFEVL